MAKLKLVYRHFTALDFTPEERDMFLAKIIVPDESGACWSWGGYHINGYPFATLRQRSISAARLAFELFKGYTTVGKFIRSCNNSRCLNPEHFSTPVAKQRTIGQIPDICKAGHDLTKRYTAVYIGLNGDERKDHKVNPRPNTWGTNWSCVVCRKEQVVKYNAAVNQLIVGKCPTGHIRTAKNTSVRLKTNEVTCLVCNPHKRKVSKPRMKTSWAEAALTYLKELD